MEDSPSTPVLALGDDDAPNTPILMLGEGVAGTEAPVLAFGGEPTPAMAPLSLDGASHGKEPASTAQAQPGSAISAAISTAIAGTSMIAAQARRLLQRPKLKRQVADAGANIIQQPGQTQIDAQTHNRTTKSETPDIYAHSSPNRFNPIQSHNPNLNNLDDTMIDDEDNHIPSVPSRGNSGVSIAPIDAHAGKNPRVTDSSLTLSFDAMTQTKMTPCAPPTRRPNANPTAVDNTPRAPPTRVNSPQPAPIANDPAAGPLVLEVLGEQGASMVRRLIYRVEDQVEAIRRIEPAARAMQSLVTRQRRLQDALAQLERFLRRYE